MTKNEIKEKLLAENPTLRIGNDQDGYIQLSAEEYETTINTWAENSYAEQQKQEAEAVKKAAAEAKLAALGLTAEDLKALGLGGN